jgi:hypothetical protein
MLMYVHHIRGIHFDVRANLKAKDGLLINTNSWLTLLSFQRQL